MIHIQFLHPFDDLVNQFVVDGINSYHSAASRTFLSLETVGSNDCLIGRIIEVGGLIDDHSVLAAHLEDGTFDPHLAIVHLGSAFMNTKTDFL
ncbi:hypothetical protein BMS3Bbin04_00877 [bacterium BMS3Bbin04]|nr:hypothetical protein BMS3Bbin04_00877 [bacterium BMS3Bbin04]